jgi:hypothetical protein
MMRSANYLECWGVFKPTSAPGTESRSVMDEAARLRDNLMTSLRGEVWSGFPASYPQVYALFLWITLRLCTGHLGRTFHL